MLKNNLNKIEKDFGESKLAVPSDLKWDIITSTYVDISWRIVGGAVTYNVYRATKADGDFAKVATVTRTEHEWLKPLYRDNDVAVGTTYYYKVTAVNNHEESGLSDMLAVMITNYPAAYKFDFGTETSPVAEGYTKVTNNTAYTKELGYGFTDISKVDAGFRSETPAEFGDVKLVGDFCLPKKMMEPYSFNVDLPNGLYGIKIVIGDSSRGVPNATHLEINGTSIGTVGAGKGLIADKTFTAVVTDGQMRMTFSQNGRVNVLEITPIVPEPHNLEASKNNSSVVLNWSEVSGAASYDIYRAVAKETSYIKVGNSSITSYNDDTIMLGTTYSYKISAVTVNGESPLSNEVQVQVVDASIKAPASPKGVEVIKTSASFVELKWSSVNGAERYNVYRYDSLCDKCSDEKNIEKLIYIGSTKCPYYMDNSITTEIEYSYVISALNAGGESEKSSTVTSRVAAAPKAPDELTVSNVTETSVRVNWNNVKGAVSYNVYKSNFAENEYALVGNTKNIYFDDASLSKGNTYNYVVTAVNAAGESERSKEVLAMTKTEVTLLATLDLSAAGPACRMRLGDLNGDGRMEILMVQPDYMGKESKDGVATGRTWADPYAPHAVQCLTAFDLEGNILWQVGTPDLDMKGSGADEPAQIYDIDDDGFNEVLCVMSDTVTSMVDGVKTIESRTEKFFIFDGKTGKVKKEYELPKSEPCGFEKIDIDPVRAHDNIIIANLRGTEKPQDIILKDRYFNMWAFDNEFNPLWTYTGSTGHYPWPYDFDGDGKDEIFSCYDLIDHDGTVLWSAQDVSDHADCIWVGNVDGNDKNEKQIIIGGSATLVYNRRGEELWRNETAIEPQQILVGNYVPNRQGLEIYGMDRVARGWDSFYGKDQKGMDCLYLMASTGETIFRETPGEYGFTTATKLLRNWTGTYAPLTMAFKRGAINGVEIKPALYDGYFNVIAEIPASTWTNIMIANICGDSKEEIIAYQPEEIDGVKKTIAYIYSNGEADLRDSITGKTLMQIKRDYNFTRYGSDEVDDIDKLVPSNLSFTKLSATSNSITWTPVLGANFYNVYRAEENGEYAKVGISYKASFKDNAVVEGKNYEYKVVPAV